MGVVIKDEWWDVGCHLHKGGPRKGLPEETALVQTWRIKRQQNKDLGQEAGVGGASEVLLLFWGQIQVLTVAVKSLYDLTSSSVTLPWSLHSSHTGTHTPQGICTCCLFHPEHSFHRYPHGYLTSSFKSCLKVSFSMGSGFSFTLGYFLSNILVIYLFVVFCLSLPPGW